MISIIISSIRPKLLSNLKENVKNTIGVDYEFIVINNNVENLNISAAYNKGAEKAKYPYIVFCHEDILFHTQNWGKELIKLLNIDNVGLVGVSGATYKSQYPTSWISVPKKYYRINAIQRFKSGKREKITLNPQKENFSKVAVLDGFFLSTTKKIFDSIKFDEKNLTGFHLYDLDYSLKIFKKYHIIVSHNILIEHFSEGNLDKTWFNESIKWHKKHKKELPIHVEPLNSYNIKEINYLALQSVFLNCYKLSCHYGIMLTSFFTMIKTKPFSVINIKFLKYLLSFTIGLPKMKKLWK